MRAFSIWRCDLDDVSRDLELGGDAGFGNGALVGDAAGLDVLARGDLGALALGLSLGPLARQFAALLGAADLDLALLLEARPLALALDVERLALGLEVAGADRDHRVLLDVVAQLAAGLDVLDQARQALGVEAVRGVEVVEVGLVDVGDRHRLEFQPVGVEPDLRRLAHAPDVVVASLVHLLQRHLSGDGAQGRDELAVEQRGQPLRLQRAPAERCRGEADGLARLLDADVELRVDVDAHPVAGDQRAVVRARHGQLQRVQVHRGDVVDDRPDEGAAVDHHLLAQKAGADERHSPWWSGGRASASPSTG